MSDYLSSSLLLLLSTTSSTAAAAAAAGALFIKEEVLECLLMPEMKKPASQPEDETDID